MAETLVAWGVTDVFGMVGHSNLGLADALRRREEDGELRFIGIRHEGAAAFAASAYGKLTGRPAACLTIAGPGATNLLTGLWDAHMDGAPVLALTGQVDAQVLGAGHFQEIDLQGAFGTVATWSQTVLNASRHAELAALAVRHAVLERGVAHLVFPDQVQTLPANGAAAAPPAGRLPDLAIAPPAAALAQAIDLLAGARRPVIIAGTGAHPARADVIALAEHLGAPVMTTFRAKGLIADDHPLACGTLGRSGTPIASWVMNEADALIVIGASFANHTGIYAGKPIVHVDRDPLQLGRTTGVAVPLLSDAGVAARALMEALPARADDAPDQAADVAARRALWATEKAGRAADDRGQRRRQRRRLRRAQSPRARGRGDRRRRRQPRVQLRPLPRVARRPGRADVRPARLDRLRLPGGDRRLGGDARRAPGDRRHRRRRLRAVHGRGADGRQARDGHHPRDAQQRPARQDQQGAARRASGTSGRPSCTTPTSRSTPSCAARWVSA